VPWAKPTSEITAASRRRLGAADGIAADMWGADELRLYTPAQQFPDRGQSTPVRTSL
jgi:hypothetical protein